MVWLKRTLACLPKNSSLTILDYLLEVYPESGILRKHLKFESLMSLNALRH
jgi:hypothetical protein